MQLALRHNARGGTARANATTVNGYAVRYRSYLGRARVVTFVPADLDLIGGRAVAAPVVAQRRALAGAPAYYARSHATRSSGAEECDVARRIGYDATC